MNVSRSATASRSDGQNAIILSERYPTARSQMIKYELQDLPCLAFLAEALVTHYMDSGGGRPIVDGGISAAILGG